MLKKIIVISLWIGICSVVGYLSPTLPLVKDIIAIKTVKVKGTDKLTEEDIKEIFESQNWFFLTEDYVNEKLKKYSFVKRAIVYKPEIGQVNVIIEERKPFAIVTYKGKNYLIDQDGEIINQNISNEDNLLKINIINSYLSINELFSKINLLDKNLNIEPKEIILSNEEMAIINKNNSIIIFSLENIEEEIEKAKIFFAKNSMSNYSYLNFSFDEMVIAKK